MVRPGVAAGRRRLLLWLDWMDVFNVVLDLRWALTDVGVGCNLVCCVHMA